MKKNIFLEKGFLKKSLKCVFSHVPHLYLLPAFKGAVSVREQAELSLVDKW